MGRRAVELGRDDRRRSAAVLRRLGELQTQFEHLGGYELKNRAEQALCGLGFAVKELYQPFRSFSGGWQSRAELARLGAAYWVVVGVSVTFMLARFSEAFLLLRAQSIGMPLALVPAV